MKRQQNMNSETKGRLLWFVTPASACLSGISLIAALCGKEWINMEERMLNTTLGDISYKRVFAVKRTYAGLFIICETDPGESYYKCSNIDLFSKSIYVSDISDSSSSVPYAILQSLVFFLLAVSLLVFAEILLIYGYIQHTKRFLLPMSGLLFIISGLMILLGIVVFIATLKGEIAEKLRPESSYEPPLVTYRYGWSFMLVLIGFISEELCGVLAFFFYKHWHKHYWLKKKENRITVPTAKIETNIQTPRPRCDGANCNCQPSLLTSQSLPSLTVFSKNQSSKGDNLTLAQNNQNYLSEEQSYKFSEYPPLEQKNDYRTLQTSDQYWDFHKRNNLKRTSPPVSKDTFNTMPRTAYVSRSGSSHNISEAEKCQACEINQINERIKFLTIDIPRRSRSRVRDRYPRYSSSNELYASENDCWCSNSYESTSKYCNYCYYSQYDCCSGRQNIDPLTKPRILKRREQYITV